MIALDEIISKLDLLPEKERDEIHKTAYRATRQFKWLPNLPGPQYEAYNCLADELFYGGEAGGGKTDLLLGTALNNHRRSLILRRLNGEVAGLAERLEQILGTKKGYSGSPHPIWRFPDRLIKFGGCQYLDDRMKYQGTPNDLIGFDEVSNFLKAQYEFIIAWNRSTFPGQRVRVIATGNPPTTAEGEWVIQYWGPWLDKNHPNPAVDGELRWFTTVGDNSNFEVEGPGPVVIDGIPLLDNKGKPIFPRSRTFIRAELADNPDLEETGYGSRLAALPGTLRAGMMEGDFAAGQVDDAWQLIPSAWVDAAFERWTPAGKSQPMEALAVDVAIGGADKFTLGPRHGKNWFDKITTIPGREIEDGPTAAGYVFKHMRDGCEVILDMGGGYGLTVRDHLRQIFSPTPYDGSGTAEGMKDKTNTFKFHNIRAAAHWFLMEALDPDHGAFLQIFPDPELKADLCSIHYKIANGKVLIQAKDEIKDLIGRSPDKGDTLVMAHFAKGKTNHLRVGIGGLQSRAITSGRNPNRRP